MPYGAVMTLPMRVFWHLSGSVDRLADQEDKRRLELQINSHSAEAALEAIALLAKRSPEAIQFSQKAVHQAHFESSAERDPDAMDVLRSLAG